MYAPRGASAEPTLMVSGKIFLFRCPGNQSNSVDWFPRAVCHLCQEDAGYTFCVCIFVMTFHTTFVQIA